MRRESRRTFQNGFTLVELLVVIAIIGVLSVLVLLNLSVARRKARDVSRAANLKNIQTALESYNDTYGFYPKTFNPGNPIASLGECFGAGNNYIPGIVPEFLPVLPSDIVLNCSGPTHSWVYASNGIDYKLITHPEDQFNFKPKILVDPAWDGGSNPCIIDGSDTIHVGMWTSGAICWSI